MSNLDLTPEQKQLREKLEQLKQEFSRLFSLKNEMKTYEEPYLTSLYTELIGTKQYEFFCKNTELSMLKRKIEYMQSYINRNEKPDVSAVNKKIEKDFSEYNKKLEEQAKHIAAAKELLSSPLLTEEEVKQIKETYYAIVKRLHPDINPNTSDYEKDLFLKAQIAYDMSNLTELKQIFLALEIRDEKIALNNLDIRGVTEDMENKVVLLENQIEKLNTLFPFNHRENLSNPEWIREEQSKYDILITDIVAEIEKYKTYLMLLEEWIPE